MPAAPAEERFNAARSRLRRRVTVCMNPESYGENPVHQNPRSLIAMRVQALIDAPGYCTIGKFPRDRLYPDSLRTRPRPAELRLRSHWAVFL